MCTLKFYPEIRHFKCKLYYLLLAIISFFLPLTTVALSTDKEQPIEIESDHAELDSNQNSLTYKGNIRLTQGSILITGDTLTIYFDNNKQPETIIMEGTPSRYRQLPDDSEHYNEAEAFKVEYYKADHLVIFTGQASMQHAVMSFSGNRIEYDSKNGKIKLGDIDNSDELNNERVKIIIKPPKFDD